MSAIGDRCKVRSLRECINGKKGTFKTIIKISLRSWIMRSVGLVADGGSGRLQCFTRGY